MSNPATAPSNVAYDSSSFSIRFHLSVFPLTKITLPEEKLKQDVFPEIGEQYATHYTPGIVDAMTCEAEMITTRWKRFLAALPDPISSAVFPITGNSRHPTVRGSYTWILDDCGIIGTKEEIEASEKANKITISFRVMRKLMRGDDNVWKTLARRPGVSIDASANAQALMKF